MALMLLAALGALSAFTGSVGMPSTAGPETVVVKAWRLYGFLVFPGLFVPLAVLPRRYAEV